MHRLRTDPALYFFGLVATCCLVVSIPATATAMELFHGQWWGIVATVVFELGAVGAELSTLAIPQWRRRLLGLTVALLLATTGANYALGVDAFVSTALPRTYAQVQQAGAGWLLAVVASALFPALLFVFLTAFTARWRMLRGHFDTPMAAVAFWLSSAWQIVSSRMTEAEQARTLFEQIAADAKARADQSEQELEQVRREAEQLARSYEQRMTEAEQARTLFEQIAADARARAEQAEQALEQARREAEQLARSYEQQLTRLRTELNTRPALVEVEVVKVARYQLTYEQMAALLNTSVSTVRRRLPEIAGKEIAA